MASNLNDRWKKVNIELLIRVRAILVGLWFGIGDRCVAKKLGDEVKIGWGADLRQLCTFDFGECFHDYLLASGSLSKCVVGKWRIATYLCMFRCFSQRWPPLLPRTCHLSETGETLLLFVYVVPSE
jgi:hypothetical protein